MITPFVGEIRMFGGNFAPQNWALCDGQLLNISDCEALYSLFGTKYGGDGVTTFGLPDLRGRVGLHQGEGPGLKNRPIASKGGVETVALTTDEVPSHSHNLTGQTAPASASAPAGQMLADGTINAYGAVSGTTALTQLSGSAITNAGSGEAHDNMMPYQVINFIVALQGIYPTVN